jgi:hypothetical protein
MPDQPAPRRRFQFRLRTIFIGVTLLSSPCAYIGWEAKVVRQREEFLNGHDHHLGPNPFNDERGYPNVPWIQGLLGSTPVYEIFVAGPADAERAAALFPEAIIRGPDSRSP